MTPTVPIEFAAPVLATALLAIVTDVRGRRVPNALTGLSLLVALGAHAALGGRAGLGDACAGAGAVALLLLPGWWMGWMGGGDVKLMAAAGAWLGFTHGTVALLAALLAGGVLALATAMRHGVLKRSIWGAAALASWTMARGIGSAPPVVTTGIRFPFAFAALAGVVVALMVRA